MLRRNGINFLKTSTNGNITTAIGFLKNQKKAESLAI